MTSTELNNQANGTRLSRLLIDKGTKVLKAAFDLQYPPATLAADLIADKPTLKPLRYKAISAAQWKLLYPAAGPPDSKNFDITLLTVLLQHLCGLMPATGWSAMPAPSNTSIAANILRIKLYRNQIYAHITSSQIDDFSFEYFWREISKALVALGIPQREIDELKGAPISPEEDEYIEQLKEWKKSEDEIKEKLDETHGMVKDIRGQLEEKSHEQSDENVLLQLANCNFRGNIECLAKSCYPGTRDWLLQKVNNWFEEEDSLGGGLRPNRHQDSF